jgi:hypothetical protein
MDVDRLPPRIEFRNALLCGLAVVVAVAITNPICNSPFNDDWSYSFTVKKLLETGKLTYNGWASASFIAQAYWGLLWVKMFGFSYTVLRLSTVPLAAAAISICYLLGRRVGLIPKYAVFAALMIGLCPLYLPVADSFMSDAPGLFCIFLTMYLLDRAIQSTDTSNAIAWLIAGLVIGGIGGTARQVVWVVPLLMAPYAAWLRRDNKTFVLASAIGCALLLAAALLTMHWFARQPYSIPEIPIATELKLALHDKAHYPMTVAAIGLTLIWMILPILWKQWQTWTIARAIIAFVLLLGVLLLFKVRPQYELAPWLENTLSKQGVMGPNELPGIRPIAMPLLVRKFFGIPVFLAVCCVGADLLIWLARPVTAWRNTINFLLFPRRDKALLPAMILFAAAYLVLLLPRAASHMVYDRYVLPVMACVLFPLLLGLQNRGERKVPAVSWVLLGIYAIYGIAITQDINALLRARTDAGNRLLAAGIPRVRINGGFEFDAQTQLETNGYINDFRIRIPAHAETHTTSFGHVDYISFLYPFHRRIYADEFNDPWWLDAKRAATRPSDRWHRQAIPSDNVDAK